MNYLHIIVKFSVDSEMILMLKHMWATLYILSTFSLAILFNFIKILGGNYYQLEIKAKEPAKHHTMVERFRLSDFTFNILSTSTTL